MAGFAPHTPQVNKPSYRWPSAPDPLIYTPQTLKTLKNIFSVIATASYSLNFISTRTSFQCLPVNTVYMYTVYSIHVYYPLNGAFHKSITCCLLYAFLSHDPMRNDPFAAIICLVTFLNILIYFISQKKNIF